MGSSSPKDVYAVIRTMQASGFTVLWKPPEDGAPGLHVFTASKDHQTWTASQVDPHKAVMDLKRQLAIE